MEKPDSIQWCKSSRCATNTCVEVAKVNGEYLVRDGKNPDIAPLVFTAAEWGAFVQGVKDDEFSL